MAESTLALKKADYDSAVGWYLGFGRGALFGETAWTTAQQNLIDAHVKTGLRRFYYPSLTPNSPSSYAWSFLKPTASITLYGSKQHSMLPDDFNTIDGPFSVTNAGGTFATTLYPTPVGRIGAYYAASPTSSGQPMFLAIEPVKATTALEGQRYRVLAYPIPDADYTLTCQYSILPDCLTGSRPYCYGSEAHADTIRESCLAAAEKDSDDFAGVHEQQFQVRLAASISMDRGLQPQMLGYNGDRSVRGNRFGYGSGYNEGWRVRVSVNGVFPG